MTAIPESIKRFIDAFSALPAIGPRQATRLAFHLIRQGKHAVAEMADAVRGLGALAPCARCFYVARAGELCDICADPNRRKELIAVVEKETDILSLERAKRWQGRYLVLGDITKDGVLTSMQKLRIGSLKDIIRSELGGQAEEIVVALSHTTYANLDAALIINELRPFAKKITRLGRGLPTGGEIEFADEETLGGALEHRG